MLLQATGSNSCVNQPGRRRRRSGPARPGPGWPPSRPELKALATVTFGQPAECPASGPEEDVLAPGHDVRRSSERTKAWDSCVGELPGGRREVSVEVAAGRPLQVCGRLTALTVGCPCGTVRSVTSVRPTNTTTGQNKFFQKGKK